MNPQSTTIMRILIIWLLVAPSVAAGPVVLPRQALDTVRRIAIQHNGRNKPFDSFARETVQLITGSPRVEHRDPVETVLVIMANPDHWQQVPLVSVPFIPLREKLGMSPKATHISYNDLVASRKLMRMLPAIVQKQQREEKLSILEEETMDAFQRFVALSGLFEQKLALVPPPPGVRDQTWQPISQPEGYSKEQQEGLHRAWSTLLQAIHAAQPRALQTAATELSHEIFYMSAARYPAAWRLELEIFYNRAMLFRIAQLLYLLAVIGLFLGLSSARNSITQWGLGACVAAFVLHGIGIAMRVIIGGRPPVSNFFETTLWLPFVAVAVALILERIYHARYIALAASMLAAVTLVLAEHLPLDSSISPVVAVLHSNLWLTVHVLTIVASYGALALAMALAHVYGVLYLTKRFTRASRESLDTWLYRVLQVGVILLAGGIMLGAVWANASWGRYWGWDPKETWALITLLWFLAVLHGRFAGWITGVGVALSTISGFFLLLMTYYGVSFYLVGLHSYAGGHAKPVPPLLIGYLMAEVAFLLVVGLAALSRRR